MASNKTYWQGAGSTTEDDDKRPAGVTVAGLRDDDEPTGKAQAAKGIAEKTAREGVTERAFRDENTGRFLPGISPNPLGRPTKAKETAVLDIMKQRINPELIVDKIEGLLNHASSWRAQAEGIRLYFDYTVGRPVQRTEQQEDALEVLFARLRSLRGAE